VNNARRRRIYIQFENWQIYLVIIFIIFILVYTTAAYYEKIKDYYYIYTTVYFMEVKQQQVHWIVDTILVCVQA